MESKWNLQRSQRPAFGFAKGCHRWTQTFAERLTFFAELGSSLGHWPESATLPPNFEYSGAITAESAMLRIVRGAISDNGQLQTQSLPHSQLVKPTLPAFGFIISGRLPNKSQLSETQVNQ